MRNSIMLAALIMSAGIAAAPAAATTIDLTSSNDSNLTGAAGNSFSKSGTMLSSATAWNLNYDTTSGQYKLTQSYLGTYQKGLGVTSAYDDLDPSKYSYNGGMYNADCTNGNCGTHQIDNMGESAKSQSYDFVALTFTDAVTLTGLTLNSFGTVNADNNAAFFYDTDFSYSRTNTALVQNKLYNLSDLFSAGSSASVARTTCESTTSGVCADMWTATASDVAAGTASKVWLVASSINGSYGGDKKVDSFKVGSVSVNKVGAVPEPATWASMVMGFGLAGSALRRRRALSPRQA